MGIFIKFIILALIIALAAPFVLKGPNGKSLMSAEDLVPTSVLPGVKGSGDTVYKWQDSNGVWQFGEKPPGNLNADAIVLDDSNITPLESGWEGEYIDPEPNNSIVIGNTPLSVITQAPEMIKAAKNARDLSNQHTGDLQNLMKEISRHQ